MPIYPQVFFISFNCCVVCTLRTCCSFFVSFRLFIKSINLRMTTNAIDCGSVFGYRQTYRHWYIRKCHWFQLIVRVPKNVFIPNRYKYTGKTSTIFSFSVFGCQFDWKIQNCFLFLMRFNGANDIKIQTLAWILLLRLTADKKRFKLLYFFYCCESKYF